MAEPLSALSGAAAVCGLADILARTAKSLYVFFGELRDASKNTKLLILELQELESLFGNVQQYIDSYVASPFGLDDNLTIPEITQALNACLFELNTLRGRVEAMDIKSTDGKVKCITKKLKWVFEEGNVTIPLRNIKRLKSNLMMALSTCGRRGDISLRHQVKAIGLEISNSKTASNSQFKELETTVHKFSARTQQLLQTTTRESASETQGVIQNTLNSAHVSINDKLSSMTSSIDLTSSRTQKDVHTLLATATATTTALDSEREKLQATQSMIEVGVTKTRMQIRRGSKEISQKLDKIHKNSRRSSISQAETSDLLAKKLDDINAKFASIVMITDNATSQEATIQSFNLAAVTLPLMLIKADIFMMLKALVSENELTASQSDMDIFSSELYSLLSECHMASARAERCAIIPDTPKDTPQSYIKPFHNPPVATSPPRYVERKRRFFFKETSAGLLTMELETAWGYPGQEEVVSGIYIAFIPSIQAIKNGVHISFEKVMRLASRNAISRNIRLFNIIIDDTFLEHLLQKDDVKELRKLLTKRVITPWDRTDYGYPIILLAASAGAVTSIKELLTSGASWENDGAGYNALCYIWVGFFDRNPFNIIRGLPTSPSVNHWIQLSNLAIRNGVEPENDHPLNRKLDSLMHMPCKSTIIPKSITDVCTAVCKYFISINCTTESVNEHRETPLLCSAQHFGKENIPWIRALLENGANINATDGERRNALHLSLKICEKKHSRHSNMIHSIILEKLTILLSSKCDAEGTDSKGLTPSDYASANNLSEVWEQALISTGRGSPVKAKEKSVSEIPSIGDQKSWFEIMPQYCHYCTYCDYKCSSWHQSTYGRSDTNSDVETDLHENEKENVSSEHECSSKAMKIRLQVVKKMMRMMMEK